jgi:hypothetical protein
MASWQSELSQHSAQVPAGMQQRESPASWQSLFSQQLRHSPSGAFEVAQHFWL